MRVRMLTSICGQPPRQPGDILDLADGIARVWIAEGLAAPVRDAEAEQAIAEPTGEATTPQTLQGRRFRGRQ